MLSAWSEAPAAAGDNVNHKPAATGKKHFQFGHRDLAKLHRFSRVYYLTLVARDSKYKRVDRAVILIGAFAECKLEEVGHGDLS